MAKRHHPKGSLQWKEFVQEGEHNTGNYKTRNPEQRRIQTRRRRAEHDATSFTCGNGTGISKPSSQRTSYGLPYDIVESFLFEQDLYLASLYLYYYHPKQKADETNRKVDQKNSAETDDELASFNTHWYDDAKHFVEARGHVVWHLRGPAYFLPANGNGNQHTYFGDKY
eukprot:CAMPEP_0174258538 /NCGR_PEP_ID=MMETSP0439-20130205/7516_1 /TAXON_ID=0 /ORGANISM="Stereomyxa ramosa, Strain Chinc5" /LENGTH=168 /DNA_ID=CAMNT_0015342079 /DNA_START=227 /DNA_END=733 /DNA_ORIENTATION=-